MSKKISYRFNPETLQYEEVKVPVSKKLVKGLLMTGVPKKTKNEMEQTNRSKCKLFIVYILTLIGS